MSSTNARDSWDAIEHAILRAAEQPSTVREVADAAGITTTVAKAQIEGLVRAGSLVQSTSGRDVRYRLTLVGHKRLPTSAGATNRAAA